MKILLFGKNGQVGWELQRTLAPLGEVIALGRKELDLADQKETRQTVRSVKPDLIVNAAAYTAVDKAEEEPELAMAVNGIAPGILAEEAKRLNIRLVHYSTDYVFDGTKTTPYKEDDEPNPINVYGKTKLTGEQAIQEVGVPHFIFRTSWVYGTRGKNFLLTIQRLAQEREELRVVDDQIGTPTWSRMIAEVTSIILAQGTRDLIKFLENNSGIYNLTASGTTSWSNFAETILKYTLNSTSVNYPKITPIKTSEYFTTAIRPKYSVLQNIKIKQNFFVEILDWQKGLELCVKEKYRG